MKNAEVGKRVLVNAPGTAWHGFSGTVEVVNPFGRCAVHPDGHCGPNAWYDETELEPESAVDRLAQVELEGS